MRKKGIGRRKDNFIGKGILIFLAEKALVEKIFLAKKGINEKNILGEKRHWRKKTLTGGKKAMAEKRLFWW